MEKVVLVRFDSTILLREELDLSSQSVFRAVFTIRYLHEARAKIILLSDWRKKSNLELLNAESVAGMIPTEFQRDCFTIQRMSYTCVNSLRTNSR